MAEEANDTRVEVLTEFRGDDLDNLCQAMKEAIIDGEGLGWLKPPAQSVLEAYWGGVLLVPERTLVVARLNGTIVGTAQLIAPPSSNAASAFGAELSAFFIAPWARGHGLARGLMSEILRIAKNNGFRSLDLHVRADRKAAITLFKDFGFRMWGEKDRYALVDQKFIAGQYYSLDLEEMPFGDGDDDETKSAQQAKSKKRKPRTTSQTRKKARSK